MCLLTVEKDFQVKELWMFTRQKSHSTEHRQIITLKHNKPVPVELSHDNALDILEFNCEVRENNRQLYIQIKEWLVSFQIK